MIRIGVYPRTFQQVNHEAHERKRAEQAQHAERVKTEIPKKDIVLQISVSQAKDGDKQIRRHEIS
jgi:hypothetical protein